MKNENTNYTKSGICYKNRNTISCQATGIETLSISTIMESEI